MSVLYCWQQCLIQLQEELSSTEFSIWIRPLQIEFNNNVLALYAPNRFVFDWVRNNYLKNINALLNDFCGIHAPLLHFKIGKKNPSLQVPTLKPERNHYHSIQEEKSSLSKTNLQSRSIYPTTGDYTFLLKRDATCSNIILKHNFENFIEGKTNQLACTAARQVVNNLGDIYNPLFVYSGTGLGKTHLLHAVRNSIIQKKINAKVIYIHAELFVQNMVKAIKNNTIEEFKNYYRSVDALLIDDIQFFAHKERSQEELFHTFNSLIEENRQVILTSDRYPSDINGVEDRLKSRFSWGLTVAIDPPDLDMRVSILMKKANENDIFLVKEVAFFIAKQLHSNVRELEGALHRIIANVNLTGQKITIDFVQETLRDLIILRRKLFPINKIQKTVAEFYKIRVSELNSKHRSRSIVCARQMAIALSRELTHYSLSEIGDAFGGRDHTTVLYSCRKIDQLRKKSCNIKEDFSDLIKILSAFH